MTKPSLLLLLLSIGTIATAIIVFAPTLQQLGAPTQAVAAQHPNPINKHSLPNEHFYLQRAYPDFNMSVSVVKNALMQARQTAAQSAAAKQGSANSFDADWTIEGPANIGGRMNTVAVHPTNADIIYAGSSRGGIYKTTDGGTAWLPIFDEPLFTCIGDIEIAPSDPNTIYVGTGDVNISSFFSVGDGVYRSTDAGATWQNIGLTEVGIVAKIVIDPNNANRIFVAAMGNPLARDENRGVYRTENGGATWQKILFVDDDAGIIDLIINRSQPNTLYAASWNRIRNLQETVTHEQDSKIWKTTDGGDTWTELGGGLPDNFRSRIGLSIATQNTNRLAAVYVDSTEALLGVFVTDNGGESWEQTANADSFGGDPLGGFGWYFGKIYFHPQDDQRLFVLGVDMYQSLDGGVTWATCAPPWWYYEVHADKHCMAFDSNEGILLGTDGGLYRSNDDTFSWQDIEYIPNTQFYRVTVNPHLENNYCGGAQDNGTTMGNADIINEWPRLFGGDGFTAIFHPTNPDVFYVETQWGNISFTQDNGLNFEAADTGIDPTDRRNWDMPYIISPHEGNAMYAGTSRLYRSNDNLPPLYEPISDDLTDGNIYGDRFHNITTIDESALTPNYLYVGTSDGNVWRSLDSGATWQNINGVLPDRYVTSVKASPHQLNTVYVSISGYKGNGILPHVFKSANNGSDWTDISGNLPPIAVNDLLVLPEDTTDQILLAATDAGVYMTADAGITWQRLGGNMPIFSIFDIDYDPRNHKLVAATFARSIMSFDLSEVIDFDSGNASVGGISTDYVATQQATLQAAYDNTNHTIRLQFAHLSTNMLPTNASVQLLSLNGTHLITATWTDTDKPTWISTNQLPSGIYIVQVSANSRQYAQKVLITH